MWKDGIPVTKEEYAFESVVRLSALIIGEYGYLVYKKSEEMTLSKQADLLWKYVNISSNKIIYYILKICELWYCNKGLCHFAVWTVIRKLEYGITTKRDWVHYTIKIG